MSPLGHLVQEDEWEALDEGVEWDDIDEDLRGQVEDFAEDSSNIDEDAPCEEDERSERRTKDSTYIFCPLPHRLPIIRLYAKHASQHTLLPERHGQSRNAEEIWRDAVDEMYHHCKRNNLCDVWAYLWNSWYRRDRWKLWARSAYPESIPCKRTTMVVEALWRNLKRLVLHLYNRPPVDLAVFAIVTKTLPPYRLTLNRILTDPRSGRAKSLSHMQRAFKKSWIHLHQAQINGSYTTDTARWTCDCGPQKYHAYLL